MVTNDTKPTTPAKSTATKAELVPVGGEAQHGILRAIPKHFSFEKYMSWPKGEPVVGIFRGPGNVVPMEDQNKKGEWRDVGTWLIQVSESMTFALPTGAQLDTKLPRYPLGEEICVVMHADKVTSKKNNQVSDFAISTPASGWLPVDKAHKVAWTLAGGR